MAKEEFAMFDTATANGRMLTAALALAARRSWAEVTLHDIAAAAGVSMRELRSCFRAKSEVIGALIKAVDDELLGKVAARGEGQERRDMLFDAIMTRFDILAPHKAALKSMHAASADLGLAAPYLASQYWMLQAAGIPAEGPLGAVRIAGLAATYAAVFRVWLADDDAGLARTMAALDRRLRRGERAVASLERVGGVLQRIATEGPRFLRTVFAVPPASPATGESAAGNGEGDAEGGAASGPEVRPG
jgi:AcrR family transcriptional regulator